MGKPTCAHSHDLDSTLVADARVVVLASGSGTLAQAIFDAAAAQGDFEVVALITDKPRATVVERALIAGVDVHVIPVSDFDTRDDWDAELCRRLRFLAPDLIVSAGFMRLIGTAVLTQFEGSIINSHPSLLPAFPGGHAVTDALAAGVTHTGATVHLVDSGMDTGRVLAQVVEEVRADDSVDTLHERIKVKERQLIVEVIRQQLANHK